MAGDSTARDVFAILVATTALGALGTIALATTIRYAIPTPQHGARPDHGDFGVPAQWNRTPRSSAELEGWLSERVRLRPDTRALLALDALHRMRGANVEAATARWIDGRWALSVAGHDAGTLAADADFGDLLDVVAREAGRLPPLGETTAPIPDAVTWPTLTPSRDATVILDALDAAWTAGARRPEVLGAAARALAALTIETPDCIEGADVIAAQALAALGWARAVGRPETTAEALLAKRMGYDAAAARTVDASDATVGDEAVGPWVRRDDAALRALATRDDARERTRYLWFLRLVERRDGGAAASWAASSLHASSSRLPVAAFVSEAYDVEPLDLARRIAAREPSLRLAALEAESGAAGTTVPERSEVFARLSALTSRLRARGPFFDRGLRVARASASVLSAIAAEQRILLDVLGAPSAASEALEAFGPSSDHGDFLAWSSNLVAASDGQRDVSALLRDLSARSTVGAPLLARTYAAAIEALDDRDPRRRGAYERFSARLDGRPAHRARAVESLGEVLHDVPRQETACTTLLRLSTRVAPSMTLRCLKERADTPGLLAFVQDTSWTVTDRTRAVLFASLHGDLAAVDGAWQHLLADAPEDRTPTLEYARWLDEHGRGAEAISRLRAYDATHHDAPGIGEFHLRARLAKLLRARGDAAGALALTTPDVPGMVGSTLTQHALTLATLGRFDEAEATARQNLARYPGGSTRALLAEVFWMRGAPDRAAETLTELRASASDWHEVGTSFARAHHTASVDATLRDFAPLTRPPFIPGYVEIVTNALQHEGRADLAVATHATLPFQGRVTPVAGLTPIVREYQFRRVAEGDERALAWIRGAVPDALRAPLVMEAYLRHEEALLWSVVTPSGDDDGVECVWLLRTSDALTRGEADPHRAALVAHYGAPRRSAYALMGRYLLGDVALDEVLALATTPKRRAEVAYFVGLRAQASGHSAEASDWYQLAGLVGAQGVAETGWASEALKALSERDEPVAAIDAHPWTGEAITTPAAQPAAPSRPTAPPTEDAAPRGRRHHRHHREGRHHRGHS